MRPLICFVLITVPLTIFAAAQDKPQPNTFKRLAAPAAKQGYECSKGAAWFYPNGALRTCEVARDTSFGEATVPAGSYIYLLDNGTPSYVFLSRNTTIHGHVCRGVSHDLITSFYPGGQLKACWLAAEEEIQGVPCARTSFMSKMFGGNSVAAFFYDNGRLKSCRISRDVEIQGEKFKAGDHVFLDSQGKLANVT
jgi:hypothetical protein